MEHTKGKWMIGKSGKFSYEIVADTPYKGGRMGDMPETLICKMAWMESLQREEIEANAKLIAAAPELLEALKDCLQMMKQDLTYRKSNDLQGGLIFLETTIGQAEQVIKNAES